MNIDSRAADAGAANPKEAPSRSAPGASFSGFHPSATRARAALLARLALACLLTIPVARTKAEDPPDPWAAAIAAFEKADAEAPPPKGEIVFVGSSTIRMWNLAESFPDLVCINRGFGGSQMADSVRHAGRLVVPHAPRLVVVYAGDNDIGAGKSAETVFEDARALVAAIRAPLPETRILFLSIKPSILRRALYPEMRRANDMLRAFARETPGVEFVDCAEPMLGPDGAPPRDLLLADGLHLSAKGYALWSRILRPRLEPGAPEADSSDESPAPASEADAADADAGDAER